jgi:hypothetical protein
LSFFFFASSRGFPGRVFPPVVVSAVVVDAASAFPPRTPAPSVRIKNARPNPHDRDDRGWLAVG